MALGCIDYTLSIATKKKLVYVRKPNENAHDGHVLGIGLPERYIIVDDFLSSGTTFRAIREAVNKYGGICVGFYGYMEKEGILNYGWTSYTKLVRMKGMKQRLDLK